MKKLIKIEKENEICAALYEFEDIFPHLREKVISFEKYSEKLSQYAYVFLAYEDIGAPDCQNAGKSLTHNNAFENINGIKRGGWENKENISRGCKESESLENGNLSDNLRVEKPEPLAVLVTQEDKEKSDSNDLTDNRKNQESECCAVPFGILIMYANDKETKKAYISLIGVKREFFGKGRGAYLMSKAEEIARKEKMCNLMLEVDNDNVRAQKFYKKCGFSQCDVNSGKSFYMIKGL